MHMIHPSGLFHVQLLISARDKEIMRRKIDSPKDFREGIHKRRRGSWFHSSQIHSHTKDSHTKDSHT